MSTNMIKSHLTAVARHFAEQRFWRWATPLLAPGLALANPTGADVVAGNVAIANTDPNTLTVNQGSATASINWQSFSVGQAEYVIFNQPSASAIALNRVVGGAPSEIFGHLLSNGRIFLINPSGVLFGATAQVDVGGLVASTANISDADFAAGRYVFGNAGTASIVNDGHIIAGPNGFVVLAADNVRNTGVIAANLGEVVLAAGNAFTLDLTGDGLINFAVDQAALSAQSGVTNLGEVVADGGKVLMSARTAAGLARTVVNNQGLVQARSISAGENGEIVLEGFGGDVVNAGQLDASGINGAKGGSVTLVSDHATKLTSTSNIDTHGDGALTGGSVHVSGHTVSIRGLMNIGRGGKFLLDPAVVHITNGGASSIGGSTSAGGDGNVSEKFIEGQLQAGVDITILATQRITLDDLSDNALNGIDGSTGTDDGGLTLAIGTPAGGVSYGGGAYGGIGYFRDSGSPGGGINFADPGDAIIVGRKIVIQGGLNYGKVDVGNLDGSSVEISAAEGIKAGYVVAEAGDISINNTGTGPVKTGLLGAPAGSVNVYNAHGDVDVGDLDAVGYAGINAADGNLFLHDINVSAPSDASVYLHAGSSSSDGKGDITNNPGNFLNVFGGGSGGGHATLTVSAAHDIKLDRIDMQGGGSSGGSVSDAPVASAQLNAGHDIVVGRASIKALHRTASSSGSDGSSFSKYSTKGNAYVGASGGNDVQLGVSGEFKVSAEGDATIRVDAGHDAKLRNVHVVATGGQSNSASWGYAGSAYSESYAHTDRGAGSLQVTADNDVIVAYGDSVLVEGKGYAKAVLDAAHQVQVGGTVTVAATAAHSYGTSRNSSASGFKWGTHSSSASFGAAYLTLDGNAGVTVAQGGAVNVTGAGYADLKATMAAGAVTIDGTVTVHADAGRLISNDANSSYSFYRWHHHNDGHGEAHATLSAYGGDVKIGTTGVVNVTAKGSDADLTVYVGNVVPTTPHRFIVDGAINIDAGGAGFYTSGSGGSNWSSGFRKTWHEGSGGEAALYVNADGVTVGNTGHVNVHAYGGAEIDVTATNGGGIVVGGTVTGIADTAYFYGGASGSSESSSFTRHSSGSLGNAEAVFRANSGADGYGDFALAYGGGITVVDHGGNNHGHAKAELNLYAARDIGIDGAITVDGQAGWKQGYEIGSNSGTPSSSSHYSNRGEARLFMQTGGGNITLDSHAAVTVHADGAAEAILDANHYGSAGDVRVQGSLMVSASRGHSYGTALNQGGGIIIGGGSAFQATAFGPRGSHQDTHDSSYGSANLEIYGRDVTITGTGAVRVQAAGHANARLQAYDHLTVGGVLDVVATTGHQQGMHADGHWLSSEAGSGFEPQYGSNYDNTYGSADLSLSGYGGVALNHAINVSGYGGAHADVYGYTSSSSNPALAINQPLTVTDHGGAFAHDTFDGSDWSGSFSFGNSHDNHHDTYAGYGNAQVNLTAAGSASYGHLVLGSYGGISVSAPGHAGLTMTAAGDIHLNGAVTVSATRGHYERTHSYGTNRSSFSGSIESRRFAGSYASYGYQHSQGDLGSAVFSVNSARDLLINAPVTVNGHGWARFTTNGTPVSGDITINKAVSVRDDGSLYRTSAESSNHTYDSSYAQVDFWHNSSGTSGVGASDNLDGNAEVDLRASGTLRIAPTGSVTIQGVDEARFYGGVGNFEQRGAIAVAATPGSYRFHQHSSSSQVSGASTWDFTHDSSSQFGAANVTVQANGTAETYGGGTITVGGAGNASVFLDNRGGAIRIGGAITVADYGGGMYHSASYGYGASAGQPPYSSGDAQDQTYGVATITVHAQGDVTINAPLSARAPGYVSVNLHAGSGTSSAYGDVHLNQSVSAIATGTAHSKTSSFDDYGSNSTDGAYFSTEHRQQGHESYSAWSQIYVNANRHGAQGGHIDGNGLVTATGYGDALVSFVGQGGINLGGAVVVTANAGHYIGQSSHAATYGSADSLGNGSSVAYGNSSHYNSSYGHAQANFYAYGGGLRTAAITVSGEGYGGVSMAANNSSSVASPANGTLVGGAITIHGGAAHGTWGGSQHQHSYTLAGHAPTLNYGTDSTYDGTSSSGTAHFTASNGYAGIQTGGITLTAQGDAFVSIAGHGNVVIGAPLSVTTTQGHYHTHNVDSSTDSLYAQHGDTVRDDYAGYADVSITAYQGNVTMGALTMSGPGHVSAHITANSYAGSYGDVALNGAVSVTAAKALASQTSHSQYSYDGASSGTTVGSRDTSYGSASLSVAGRTVTIGGTAAINVKAGGYAAVDLIGGVSVTDHGTLTVEATPGSSTGSSNGSPYLSSYGSAALGVDAASITLDHGATVTGAGRARVTIGGSTDSRASDVTLGGPVRVDSGLGNYGADSSHGSAYLYLYGNQIDGTEITVTGHGRAYAEILGGGVSLDTLAVHGNTGTYGTGCGPSCAVAGFAPTVQTGSSIQVRGDATALVAGNSSLDAGGLPFGAHIHSVILDGMDVHFGGYANYDTFVANAQGAITGDYSGTIRANALGFRAGEYIDTYYVNMILGEGTAPFGQDNIADFLLKTQLADLFPNGLKANAAFSAPSVYFGNLELTGSAIFIKTNDVTYYGTIAIDSNVTLPPGGYAIRYDSFTPDATIHVVGSLPELPVEGDAYFDAADFQYPGTTYLIGGGQSNSDVVIGDPDDAANVPDPGYGGDDNFIIMTNGDATFASDIPTSGQVVVIHPLTSAGYNIIPISEDWETTTGGQDDGKKESLEHEQQAQAGGGDAGEEGTIDNESGASLECH